MVKALVHLGMRATETGVLRSSSMKCLVIGAAVFFVGIGSAGAQPPPPGYAQPPPPGYAPIPPPGYAPIPPPRAEVVPRPPHGRVVWEPGHWHWDGFRYVWIGGRYVERGPRHGHYAEGRWIWAPREGR